MAASSPIPLPTPAGFLDLNLPVTPSDYESRESKVALLLRLGYDGVAWNLESNSRDAVAPPLPVTMADVECASSASGLSILRLKSAHRADHSRFQQYSRLTVRLPVGTSVDLATFNMNPSLPNFDLVAVEPACNATFAAACSQLNVDVIVINAADKLPYRLTVALVRQAMARGVFFEVAYAPALAGAAIAKKNLFNNMAFLVRFTKGKQLLISSAASTVMQLRGPYDVINLAALFGLSSDRAKAVIFSNPHQAVVHGVNRRLALNSLHISASE